MFIMNNFAITTPLQRRFSPMFTDEETGSWRLDSFPKDRTGK